MSWLTRRQRDGGIDRIPLPADVPGRLWLCGKHAIGPDHEAAVAEVGGRATVVCLTEPHELVERYPRYVEWLRSAHGTAAVWWPVPDLHAPSPEAMRPFVADLVARLQRAEVLLVHCAAGMGRSGTTAAGILVGLGVPLDEALSTVAAARPGAGPEVGAQSALLAALASDRPPDGAGAPPGMLAGVDVPVTPDDIERAAERIGDRARRTPVVEHGPLVLKLELLQHAGSFKTRGAFNRVLGEASIPESGLIAASGGNHGAALSYVGGSLGIPTEIFMPSTSPDIKRRNIERFGATVRVIEGYYDDAQAAADARRAETGALEIHPYDHVATVAGQGTMGRELEEQVGGIDTIVVAAGGGGFIAGQAAWFRDRVRIVSVEPETSQCLRAARLAGEPVAVEVSGVAADSLGARKLGAVPWSVVRHFVDESVVVPDDSIRAAQRELWDELRLIVEPGGAAALAAIRIGAYVPEPGERVVVVVCGSNADPATIT